VTTAAAKKRLAWGFVVALGILQYDFWFWSDRSVVLGFLPVGLLYQVLISLLAALAWALVVRWAWPSWLEEWAGAEGGGEPGA
jgi:hypothetical protein